MVYDMAWRGMSWYVESYRITCIKGVPWAIVWPMSIGGHVHTYRTRSKVEGLFTCMFRSHVQLLFTLGMNSKQRDCEFIDHCSGIDISTFTVA